MDTLEAILSRRSIRRYTGSPLSEEIITDIIRCGMYAPSATNKQPWRFIVINNRSLLEDIMDFHPYARMLKGADCAILVCGDELAANTPEYWPVDCSCATQNMLLAAHAMGVGACWIGIYPRPERMEAMRKIITLPWHINPFALVSLGYPETIPVVKERFDEHKVFLNGWGLR